MERTYNAHATYSKAMSRQAYVIAQEYSARGYYVSFDISLLIVPSRRCCWHRFALESVEVHADALKRSVSVSSRNVNYHQRIIEYTGSVRRLIARVKLLLLE